MRNLMNRLVDCCDSLKDFPPLFFRLILAYGFYGPALMKINNFNNVVEWFTGMNYFMPWVSALLAATAEILGVILLTLGLGTRLITIPLMFMMVVATWTVHWEAGFNPRDGYEIPVYYFLMLFSLLVSGAGRFSLDNLLSRKYQTRL